MVSQYEHAYPVVREFFDGRGWKTAGAEGEGLVWVVRTQESINNRNDDERRKIKGIENGVLDPSVLAQPSEYADEYVIADRLEFREGALIFSLGTSQHNVSVKVYAAGYWREFHLVGDAREVARRTATMLKDDDDAEV